jgi:alkyl sulfatase BDS1-like metallo-beta-lactamase superfamily hydrolase
MNKRVSVFWATCLSLACSIAFVAEGAAFSAPLSFALRRFNMKCAIAAACIIVSLAPVIAAQDAGPNSANPMAIFETGSDQTEALQVAEHIYQATGFGNTFMITTSEGNVIIDTSLAAIAPRHKKLLSKVSDGPIKYIILTHAHADHTGGVELWLEPETEIIVQNNHTEFVSYQRRLSSFFSERNAGQFPALAAMSRNRPATLMSEDVTPTILFDDEYTFALGELTFHILHTPGETYDHLTVWIPELKAAFVGDNFYASFPNIYTLRGTKPRWAMDYVESLNRVLALKPEILIPSHGEPVFGNSEINSAVTKYRDAIQHVHDATVQGMNEGKDVYTLMQEISLPPELDVGEGYGTLRWSVRGIYEGYVGWFDGKPQTMYNTPPEASYPEIVALAGGAGKVAERAEDLVAEGKLLEGLHLADMALAADTENRNALEARSAALHALKKNAENVLEIGWLDTAINDVAEKLKRLDETGK